MNPDPVAVLIWAGLMLALVAFWASSGLWLFG